MKTVASIYDVARVAGVSVRTVSRFLNNRSSVSQKTGDKLDAAIKQLRFTPSNAARLITGKESNVIGVISDGVTTSPDSFGILRGLHGSAKTAGKVPLIFEVGGLALFEKRAIFDEIRSHGCFGVIYMAHFHQAIDSELSNALHDAFDNVVLVNCFDGSSQLNRALCPDDFGGALIATRHLIDIGCQRIGLLSLPHGMVAAKLRSEGAKSAISGHSVELIEAAHQNDLSEFEDLKMRLERLVTEHQVDGIMCANDKMASRVIHSLRDYHLTAGRDISIIGFDNHEMVIASCLPELTTVELPYEAMGHRSVEILTQGVLLTGREHLPCRLIQRGSTSRKRLLSHTYGAQVNAD